MTDEDRRQIEESIALALNDTYAGQPFRDCTFEEGTSAVMAIVAPIVEQRDQALADLAQAQSALSAWDQRLSDVQAEYLKREQSWDRTRERLTGERARLPGDADLVDAVAALRASAVVLPEDAEELLTDALEEAQSGILAMDGENVEFDAQYAAVVVLATLRPWLPATVEATPTLAETRTGTDWCANCRSEAGTNRYGDCCDAGVERCATCGSVLAAPSPAVDREALTGVLASAICRYHDPGMDDRLTPSMAADEAIRYVDALLARYDIRERGETA